MRLLYLKLLSADGGTHEATAFSTRDKQPLPVGQWRVKRNYIPEHEEIMPVSEMPDHWQAQIAKAERFGANL